MNFTILEREIQTVVTFLALGHFTKTNISTVHTGTHPHFTWYCILSFCSHIFTFVYIVYIDRFALHSQGCNLHLSTGRQGEETLALLERELFRSRRSLHLLLLVSVIKR